MVQVGSSVTQEVSVVQIGSSVVQEGSSEI